MCTKEISAFQKCYKDFKVTYEAQKTSRYTQTELAILIILMNLHIYCRDKGGLPVGPTVKMTGRQMTEYMRQFPQSERSGQANPYNPYNKNR